MPPEVAQDDQPDRQPGGGDREADPPGVDVYWRPGCPFCSSLFRSLERAGLPVRLRNIWEDAEAAAFVRAHADGNETVPTVDVAGTVLVNPPGREVLAYAAEAGISLEPPAA